MSKILLLFGPPFLLAIYSTLNCRRSSLLILIRHPSLLLLPIVTFFTFSRIKNSRDENRVIFSTRFTWINMAVSTVSVAGWLVWYSNTQHGPTHYWYETFYDTQTVLSIVLSLFVLSIILTGLFLHLDQLSPHCCECFLSPGEQLSVYDPDLDKRFIMKDGKVVEDPEDDVEDPDDDIKPPGDYKETETMVEKEKRDVEIGEGN